MAAPDTLPYESMVLEVELTPGSGTFTPLCGLDNYTVTNALETSAQNVPADCADNSKPHVVARRAVAISMTVSATGYTTKPSLEAMLRWQVSGESRLAQVRNANVTTVGNVSAERGSAFLSSIERTSDPSAAMQTVSITIEFTGAITLVEVAA